MRFVEARFAVVALGELPHEECAIARRVGVRVGSARARKPRRASPALSLRVDLTPDFRLGPGKVRLLELIGHSGSISAAGRAMEMSYRRTWLLVEEMNVAFRRPVVETARGGKRGGGAELTSFGREVVERYRGHAGESGRGGRRSCRRTRPRPYETRRLTKRDTSTRSDAASSKPSSRVGAGLADDCPAPERRNSFSCVTRSTNPRAGEKLHR